MTLIFAVDILFHHFCKFRSLPNSICLTLTISFCSIKVFKEEEEAIKVDLHEGCGRTKLFWLMALADSKTMKAMVEFREHTGCFGVLFLPSCIVQN